MLSVIIPTADAEALLVPTLAALVPGATAGLVREVIIADAGSRDATLAIADLAGCRVVTGPADAGGRLRAAAAQARGPWLLFLRPGLVLAVGWMEDVIEVATAAERQDAGAAAAATFRPALRPVGGLLIAKRSYERLGGHRPGVRDAEADLMARVGRRRLAVLACAETGS